jgi:hypothetical protein
MSLEVTFTADGIGVIHTTRDVLTGNELVEADERLRAYIARNPEIRYLLVDHSEVPEERIDVESVQALASTVKDTMNPIPEGLVAIVAPSDFLFGLSRMWETLAAHPGLSSRVVRTRPEAIAWLEEELTRRELPFQLTADD